MPSSSQKLLAVRACNRAIAARTVTKTSNIGCKPNLDDGFSIAECALDEPVETELNDVVVAII
jgi:sulfur relay (sulfurtransferase) complex TusBCD TusD component (DsrE family)